MIKLTEEQLGPVESDSRFVVVRAVPGAGKTTVLKARAKRLSGLGDSVLVCTFSKKATDEVKRRISDKAVTVQTIHSLAYSIIDEYWPVLGEMLGQPEWPERARALDPSTEMRLIEEHFPDLRPKFVKEVFDEFRRYGLTPDQMLRATMQGASFSAYSESDVRKWAEFEQMARSRGLVSFDDMIRLAVDLLTYPGVSERVCAKFDHILIDEAQDTSEDQWKLLRVLCLSAKTTMAVGDLNQSIYGWRGADGSVLRGMANMPGAEEFQMRKTWRMGARIAEFANKVAQDASYLMQLEEKDSSIEIKAYGQKEEELKAVVEAIQAQEGTCAVLARTNAYLEPYERALLEKEIPYGGAGFYSSKRVKAIAEFVRAYEGNTLVKDVEMLTRGLPEEEAEMVDLTIKIIRDRGPAGLLYLVDKAAKQRGKARVDLMTGHGAKGLEWDSVYVVGCHEGHLPHPACRDEKEESRLYYVMVSRAKSALSVSYVGAASRFIRQS